jgi:hypothetical protein
MNEELSEVVGEFSEFIRTLAPDVKIIYTDEIFEDEHANLEVYPPLTWTAAQCRNLQRDIADHALDIHLEHGYLILVYVCTPEQQIEEAERRRSEAINEVQAAERILAEAKLLGLVNGQSKPTEPVPA